MKAVCQKHYCAYEVSEGCEDCNASGIKRVWCDGIAYDVPEEDMDEEDIYFDMVWPVFT